MRAFRRHIPSRARARGERNRPKGSEVYRYPNTADANEATAVQIAAQSPSDNASTTVSAARLVNRSGTPCGDESNGFGSSQKFRRSAERADSNPVLLPIGPYLRFPIWRLSDGRRAPSSEPHSPAVLRYLNLTFVSRLSRTASKSSLSPYL